ncbi:hypothetical protein [Flavobacterium sp. JP2137]|uniref:hypothetical protein n=1 Tax=Flavobacterium sp. JP2137 TaxID=3414510 RepID=UPI003D30004B
MFLNVDPLAEQFPGWTPYHYVHNNPINLIDPTGMSAQGPQDPPEEKSEGTVNGGTLNEIVINVVGKVSQFANGVGDGFRGGWNDTKGFVRSLGTEEGWLNIARSSEVMLSPSLNSEGNSYVQNERQQIYNTASSTVSNLDQLSSYQWGYGVGYASEKVAEGLITRRFANPTTADGFLFGGVTVKAPFNIPVQRFGNMYFGKPDFWGAKIGTNSFTNRTFAAIRPEWNSLSQYTTGFIPKGTPVKFGLIGPQSGLYPGGSMQFVVPSKNVINQTSKIVK